MILFLSDLWPPFPGGAERLAFNLARDLMRRGEDVTALTGYEHPLQLDGPPVIQDLGFEVFDGRDRGGARVAAHLDEIRPDVVVTHALYAHQFERELVASGVPWVQVVLNGQRIPTAHLGVHITRWVRDQAKAPAGDLIVVPPVFDDVVAGGHERGIGFIKPIEHKGVDLVYRVARALPDRRFVVLRGEWQTLEVIVDLPNVEYLEPVADIRRFYEQVDVVRHPAGDEQLTPLGVHDPPGVGVEPVGPLVVDPRLAPLRAEDEVDRQADERLRHRPPPYAGAPKGRQVIAQFPRSKGRGLIEAPIPTCGPIVL